MQLWQVIATEDDCGGFTQVYMDFEDYDEAMEVAQEMMEEGYPDVEIVEL